ncbi:MAG TPA: hypothetical protein VKR30_06095 [Candidatus Limnocylindrales bacterium]|nr:hypothetical protein [Candidatus Limnocylindrales bacterium]
MTPELRDREAILRDLVGVAGLTALAAGLVALAPSKAIGFDPGAAAAGIVGELGETLPAAVLVLVVSLAELGTGLALARFARRAPFDSIADAILAGAVATVLKDLAVLAILGQLGLFRAPALIGVDAVLLALAWRLRPIVATSWRPSVEGLGPPLLAVLVAVIWAGPILLQLASPVVPFIDVLPNHVAPAEHLRTFGAFDPLTATQSPIYGPSRTFIGYVAVLGSIATTSSVQATLAAAAFILPTTLLIAVAAYRLTVLVAGPGAGPWALLAFALTGSFARLGDDRATVIVLPLAAWALGEVIVRTRPDAAAAGSPEPWRLPGSVMLGLALGAAVLVHPVMGALAVATVGIVALVEPGRAGRLAIPAMVTATVLALPQLATMLQVALPTFAVAVALVGAVVAGLVVDRLPVPWPAILRPLRIVLVVAAAVAVVALRPSVGNLADGPVPFLDATVLLLVAAVVGFALRVPAARSPVVLSAIGVGFATALATQLVPDDAGLLGQAIKFEVPKTLYYWIPAVTAIPAAATLTWLWERGRGGADTGTGPSQRVAGSLAVAAWIVVAAIPLRFAPIDAFHLGEHRFSEALALDLRWAGTGFWVGYPDTREIVDAGRLDLITEVRHEIDAGQIGPDTPILHVAASFQQWAATPLGVFTGVTETDVTPDAEDSIHTVGGRLLHMEDLPGALASGSYPFLLLEPQGLDPSIATAVTAAGYVPVFADTEGTFYRLGR